MKNFNLLVLIAILLFSTGCMSQTPEQKKQEEEAEKLKAQAEKQIQELMKNNPEVKNMMEELKKRQAQEQAEKEKKSLQQKKQQTINKAKNREEYYWKGKIASNTSGQFKNWKHGNVDIAIYDGDGKMDQYNNYIDKKYVVVGNISAAGKVSFNFPKTIRTPKPISKSLIPELHSVYNQDVTFSNPNTPYRHPGFVLSVIKDNNALGQLFIGNSEKVTYNLAAPCCLDYGDIGYRLYWVYSKEACTAKVKQDFKDKKITIGETEKNLDQTIIYDLDFKPGWNLIKTEVLENIKINGESRFKLKKHTVVKTMPSDAKYYFLIKDWFNQ
ncbi:hypothetical protein [Aureibaculum marinum]|nr:hypothetical protein [Aureibaculum marinum]